MQNLKSCNDIFFVLAFNILHLFGYSVDQTGNVSINYSFKSRTTVLIFNHLKLKLLFFLVTIDTEFPNKTALLHIYPRNHLWQHMLCVLHLVYKYIPAFFIWETSLTLQVQTIPNPFMFLPVWLVMCEPFV